MSAYFTFVYEKINAFFKKITAPYLKIVIGGALLGLLIYIMPPLYGEGHEIINHLKEGHPELSLSKNIFWVGFIEHVDYHSAIGGADLCQSSGYLADLWRWWCGRYFLA